MIGLIPKAVDNYEKLLDSADEKIGLQASKETLQTRVSCRRTRSLP
jgi:hypothetical protein